MRAAVALVVATLLLPILAGWSAAEGPERASGICGREAYPDADAFSADAVVNGTLWDAFRAGGGFANGTEGLDAAEARVSQGGIAYVVRLEATTVERYTGGSSERVPAVALRVAEEAGPVHASHNFTLVEFGRGGANLTLVAWIAAGDLEAFWRWAYLPCDEAFPNAYYVFHGTVRGGAIEDDNVLVYFDAPRPKRGPPADLVLLVTAGIAASAIFLLARRALKKKSAPQDSGDRTVK